MTILTVLAIRVAQQPTQPDSQHDSDGDVEASNDDIVEARADPDAQVYARAHDDGDAQPAKPCPKRYRFTRRHRLHGKLAFAAVFDQRCSYRAGPLVVYGKRNDLPNSRLGLSVSRRVGNAVKRHAIKRRLREAFRLGQCDWPACIDLIVVVKNHDTATLQQYQHWLNKAVTSLQKRLPQR